MQAISCVAAAATAGAAVPQSRMFSRRHDAGCCCQLQAPDSSWRCMLVCPPASRDEYLAESAARLAAAGGELEDVQQQLQRAKAPLLQQMPGREAEGGAPPAWHRPPLLELLRYCTVMCACRVSDSRCRRSSILPFLLSTCAAELLGGWYMQAVALFAQHGRDNHAQGGCQEGLQPACGMLLPLLLLPHSACSVCSTSFAATLVSAPVLNQY